MTPSRALQVRTPAVPGLLTAFALLIVAGCDGSPSTAPTEVVVVNPTAAVVSSQMTASAVVGSTLVDFNGLTAGQRPPDITAGGVVVSFSGLEVSEPGYTGNGFGGGGLTNEVVTEDRDNFNGQFLVAEGCNYASFCAAGFVRTLRFDKSVTNVSMYVADIDVGEGIVATAYDASGAILDAFTYPASLKLDVRTQLVDFGDIAGIRSVTLVGNDPVGIDNLRYTGPPPPEPATVDFNDLPVGPNPPSVQVDGVVVSFFGAAVLDVGGSRPGQQGFGSRAASDNNVVTEDQGNFNGRFLTQPDRPFDIRIRFNVPVSDVRLYIADIDVGAGVAVTAHDASGTTLRTFSYPGSLALDGRLQFVDFGATKGISEVRVTGDDPIGVDNLSFTAAPAPDPEPATLDFNDLTVGEAPPALMALGVEVSFSGLEVVRVGSRRRSWPGFEGAAGDNSVITADQGNFNGKFLSQTATTSGFERVIRFGAPVTNVRLYIADIDEDEGITAVALDKDQEEVARFRYRASVARDAQLQLVDFGDVTGIREVRVVGNDATGIDNLSFTPVLPPRAGISVDRDEINEGESVTFSFDIAEGSSEIVSRTFCAREHMEGGWWCSSPIRGVELGDLLEAGVTTLEWLYAESGTQGDLYYGYSGGQSYNLHRATLVVTDAAGMVDTARVVITVNDVPPVITEAPDTIVVPWGEPASVTFSFTDPGSPKNGWQVRAGTVGLNCGSRGYVADFPSLRTYSKTVTLNQIDRCLYDGEDLPAGGSLEIKFSVVENGHSSSPDVRAVAQRTITAVRPDDTPPVVTPALSATPNELGWYSGDLTVSFDVEDAESPITSRRLLMQVGNGEPTVVDAEACGPVAVTADTEGTTWTCEATSRGGTDSGSTGSIKYDNTAPTVTPVFDRETFQGSDWYRDAVTVSWTVDDISPVTTCDPVTVTEDGATELSCTANSVGGEATATTTVKVDGSPPVLGYTITSEPTDGGWYTGTGVQVVWTATEDQSTETLSADCPTVTLSDGADQTFSCTATSAGGETTVTTDPINYDNTAPVLSISGALASYDVGDRVLIACDAEDATSGASDCADIDAGAFTFGAGTTTVSFTSTNGAGLTSTDTRTFEVTVSAAGLQGVVNALVTDANTAKALNEKLDQAAKAKNENARAGSIGAFINQVNGKRGKDLSDADADLLIALATAMLG